MGESSFERRKLGEGMKGGRRYENSVMKMYSCGKVMFEGKNADEVGSELLRDKQSRTGKDRSSN
ncbi:DUF3378 domain-containing protein, partial [Staphylococcus epidermidis]|uniref:DUF3378 domain-containing protein n=1 Tax=Staphylococcus epidermidis TaxID=1282 RepID=UPI0037D9D34C